MCACVCVCVCVCIEFAPVARVEPTAFDTSGERGRGWVQRGGARTAGRRARVRHFYC